MKTPLDQFLAAAKKISLTEGERHALAQNLGIRVRERQEERPLARMTEKQLFRSARNVGLSPTEKAMSKEFILQQLEVRQRAWWLNPFKSVTSIVAAVLIVAVGGASASYAAESSLPGDLLYPVKVHVNEEVKAKLMKNMESAARWQAERAERRLKEAEALANKSALSDAAQQMITENFKQHASSVKHDVASLQASNNEAAGAVGMDFEAVLRAHAKLLGTLDDKKNGQAPRINALLADIHEARMDTEEENLLASMKKTPVAKTVMTDSTLNRARSAVVLAEKIMDPSAVGNAKETLSEAKKALSEAEKSQSMEDRMKRARAALRSAKEVSIMAKMPAKATEADNDTVFGTEVRMRIAKKAIQKLSEEMKKPMDENTAIRMETRVTGAQQLLDIAKMQMDAGRDDEALEASDMALKHTEAAEVTAEGKSDLAE